MSSQRLPGKVLTLVDGRPMLLYLLERLRHCSFLGDIVVATSTDKSDDCVKLFCTWNGVNCFRGSLENVAGRFDAIIQKYGFDAFVRVNGDSPLLDSQIIDRGVSLFSRGEFDLVTNIFPRTFPPGQSVEVIRSETFQKAYTLMRSKDDLEHVTKYYYRENQDFKIINFEANLDCSGLKMAIDTADDLQKFENVVSHMTRPHWEYDLPQILDLYKTAYSQEKNYQP